MEKRNPYIPDSSATVFVESCPSHDLHPKILVDTVNDANGFIFNNPREILQRTPYPSEDLSSITKEHNKFCIEAEDDVFSKCTFVGVK